MSTIGSQVEPGLRTVQALSIGWPAYQRLTKNGFRGSVHSVYGGAVNILSNSGIVSLVLEGVGRGPLNVTIPWDELPQEDEVDVGHQVRVSGNHIWVGEHVIIPFSVERVYNPTGLFADPVIDRLLILRNLDEVRRAVIGRGRFEGLGGLLFAQGPDETGGSELPNRLCRLALPSVRTIMEGFRTSDVASVASAAESLVGLGVGLTPSADDMLAGIMTALVLSSHNGVGTGDVGRLTSAVAKVGRGRTPILSLEYLRQGAAGRANEKVAALIEDVCTHRGRLVQKSTEEVLAMGATSGTDLVVGLMLGVRLALDRGRK